MCYPRITMKLLTFSIEKVDAAQRPPSAIVRDPEQLREHGDGYESSILALHCDHARRALEESLVGQVSLLPL